MTGSGQRIKVRRILHTIHAVRNCDPVRRRYQEILGGIVFAERYHAQEDRDMALLYVADHMIEPMAPRRPDILDTTFSRYLEKFGEGLHSFEVRIDDAPAAAVFCQSLGLELSTLYPLFFFVKPRSTGGLLVQLCGKPLVNDLKDYRHWNPDWIEGHPSSLRRLRHIACIVRDLEETAYFLCGVLSGEIISDLRVDLPQAGRQMVVRLGDSDVALFEAEVATEGLVGRYLAMPRSGIHSLVWEVDDIETMRSYLKALGVAVEPAEFSVEGIAIAPQEMFGARHEFVRAATLP